MDFAQTITVTHLFWPELAWTAGFAIVLLSMRNIYSDYKRWLKFGNGAPPNSAHFYGYSVYAIQSLWLWAIRAPGPREVTHLRSAVVSGTYLHLETDRVGSRPEMVRWLLPHRQAPPYAAQASWTARVNGVIPEIFDAYKAISSNSIVPLDLVLSRLEGFGHGLVITDDVPSVCQDSETLFREIAHVHAQDTSFHVLLSPADAITVVEKGWGERFGLCGHTMRVGRLVGRIVPDGYCLVYCPRNESEVNTVKSIIQAGVEYALKG